MKYAIKLNLDGDNDWIYVTEDTGKCDFNLIVKTFSSKDEADQYAEIFRLKGKESNVQVVTYFEEG